MKLRMSGWILGVAAALSLPPSAEADLIQRQFVQPGGTDASTGIIFQGSRNMRDLGKRRSTTSSIIVPSLNPVTVIPALRNEVLQPKPRFGYGSDYRPEAQTSSPVQTTSPVIQSTPSAPVYQFLYSYPTRRDYFVTRPFHHRFFSPYSSCWGYGGWAWGGSFGRLSFSLGW